MLRLGKLFTAALAFFAVFAPHFLNAQTTQKQKINIEHSDSFEFNDKIVSNAQRLIGNVRIGHNDALMLCDSAYSYTDRNMVDAFGKVHIVKNDTLNLFSEFINYDGDKKLAKSRRNVKLVNKTTTLTTDSMDFDLTENIAYYNNKGTIIDSTNTLTSDIGQYYTKTDVAYFKKNVVVNSKKYILHSDTLIYDTKNKIVYIVGPTTIEDDKNKLYAEKGWYNTESGETWLQKKPVVSNEKRRIEADSLYYDKASGEGKGFGHVKMDDFDNKVYVWGNKAVYNDIKKTATVTDSAMFVQYSEQDSLFLHADTLKTIPDTTAVDAKLVQAYFHVKFFKKDLQGRCDSLLYWSKDSTIQLFHEPYIWSGNNQMTAKFIEVIKNHDKPDVVRMEDNAFMIAMEPDSIQFNQIKGKNMFGYIRDNKLFRIDVDGNGESFYYAKDKTGTIGLNKAESSKISIYLENSKVKRIKLIGSPEGTLSPIEQLEDKDTKLSGFNWETLIRPYKMEDIFKHDAEPEKETGKKKKNQPAK